MPLRNMPVYVVIRLCTDEERIVNYWNDIGDDDDDDDDGDGDDGEYDDDDDGSDDCYDDDSDDDDDMIAVLLNFSSS